MWRGSPPAKLPALVGISSFCRPIVIIHSHFHTIINVNNLEGGNRMDYLQLALDIFATLSDENQKKVLDLAEELSSSQESAPDSQE
jgi:hypothetical protein